MKPSNESQSLDALIASVYDYYRQPISEFILQIWLRACQPYSAEQVSKAMNAHVTDPEAGKFCPKVADVVRILAGTHTDRAALAWSKVMGAISAVGAYQDVCFDDPAIHAVIPDLGGWSKVCRGEMAELSYLQHRFCTAYKAYSSKTEGFEYQRCLMGDRSPDGDYARRGLPPPKPAVVGDIAKARLVYQSGQAGGKAPGLIAFTAAAAVKKLPVDVLVAEMV